MCIPIRAEPTSLLIIQSLQTNPSYSPKISTSLRGGGEHRRIRLQCTHERRRAISQPPRLTVGVFARGQPDEPSLPELPALEAVPLLALVQEAVVGDLEVAGADQPRHLDEAEQRLAGLEDPLRRGRGVRVCRLRRRRLLEGVAHHPEPEQAELELPERREQRDVRVLADPGADVFGLEWGVRVVRLFIRICELHWHNFVCWNGQG